MPCIAEMLRKPRKKRFTARAADPHLTPRPRLAPGPVLQVLSLMARMLGMSDEERRQLGQMAARRSLLSRVAGAPLALVSGAGRALVGAGGGGAHGPPHDDHHDMDLHLPGAAGGGGGGGSLADQWVHFLLSQDEAARSQHQQRLQQVRGMGGNRLRVTAQDAFGTMLRPASQVTCPTSVLPLTVRACDVIGVAAYRTALMLLRWPAP